MKIELSAEMLGALAVSPVEYIRKYWEAHSTEEERAAAVSRKASPEGAFAFIESVARKHGKSAACFPDQLTYDLAMIFLRLGADGDKYETAEDIAKREKAEAERAKAREEAKKKEAERKAKLPQQELKLETKVEKKRAKIDAQELELKAKLDAARIERKKAQERQKAIAKEMENQQLTFGF